MLSPSVRKEGTKTNTLMLCSVKNLRLHSVFINTLPEWAKFDIYQYSNITPRLSGQTCILGIVFFVAKSLLGIERQEQREKLAILTGKSRSHVRILIY